MKVNNMANYKNVWILFTVSSLLLPVTWAANWMYLGVVGVSQVQRVAVPAQQPVVLPNVDPLCNSLPGLVPNQVEVCKKHPMTIKSVSDGAKKGIEECKYQFKHERWNCTTMPDGKSLFGYTIKRGSKETAFIYAVTSAGVVHAITQACSTGNLTECGCDNSRQGQPTPQGWKWGGCSDNVRYGIRFSKEFVDAPERERTRNFKNARSLMNMHNNQAGRESVVSLLRQQCRCHGVSGSCELKTCWKTQPSFSHIGDYLKSKYRASIQVAGQRLQPKPTGRAKKRLLRRKKVKRGVPVRRSDLVHIHKSPNYCEQDIKKGILGTSGRECNKTSSGPDSCDLLCCGRGFNTQVVKKVERCHCKFVWCCYVRCKTCVTMLDIHTCK